MRDTERPEWPVMLALSPTRETILRLGGEEALHLFEARTCCRCGRTDLLVLPDLCGWQCGAWGRLGYELGSACAACIGPAVRCETPGEVLQALDNDVEVARLFAKHAASQN